MDVTLISEAPWRVYSPAALALCGLVLLVVVTAAGTRDENRVPKRYAEVPDRSYGRCPQRRTDRAGSNASWRPIRGHEEPRRSCRTT
jgi:hypothetical protein